MAGPDVAPVFRAGLGRLLPPGYLRFGPLGNIPALLTRFGVDPDAFMREVGVPPEAFEHPDNAMPYKTVCRMVTRATQAIGREDIGLLISEDISPSNLGLVGFLMKQASSVREALEDLVRYLHHHDSGAVVQMRAQDGLVSLSYAVIDAAEPGSDQICDGALAIGCNILRTLCGPKWRPAEVTLSHHAPAAPARYERHFGVPVRFDAEQSAIIFDTAWLDRPVPAADPALRDMLEEQIRIMEEIEGCSFTERVRRLIRVVLLSQRGSVDQVADLLKVSKRTLERRLEEEGMSFRRLSDEVQYEVARHLIESTAMPITQIGLALKFSEASAFTRAFKKWSGLPPREWRTRHALQRRRADGDG